MTVEEFIEGLAAAIEEHAAEPNQAEAARIGNSELIVQFQDGAVFEVKVTAVPGTQPRADGRNAGESRRG